MQKKLLDQMPSDCEERQKWWNKLSARNHNMVRSLPNFDAGIFKEITGIQA